MRSKVLLFALMFMCLPTLAEERFKVKVKPRGGPDVLSESRLLMLTNESGIQRPEKPSTRGYAMSYGQLNAGDLNVSTPRSTLNYDLGEGTPLLRFSYLNLPIHWHGQWGVQAAVGYGFKEHLQLPKAVLHIVPITLEALYRGRIRGDRLWAPQFGLGAADIVFLQRGSSDVNTSESKQLLSASAGLWWGIGKWLQPNSPVPIDVTATYSRLLAVSKSSEAWSGQLIQLAIGVGL